MAQKPLQVVAGRVTQVEATVISAGAADAGKVPALDSSGRFDTTLMPVGIGADVKVLVASEAIGAGKYVNIYNNAGTPNCRLADQSNDRPAHGYVRDAVLSLGNATVYFEGSNDDLSALTAGARQYLSTAGGVTTTPPITGLLQFLGIAISATEINTDIEDAIVLA